MYRLVTFSALDERPVWPIVLGAARGAKTAKLPPSGRPFVRRYLVTIVTRFAHQRCTGIGNNCDEPLGSCAWSQQRDDFSPPLHSTPGCLYGVRQFRTF